MKKDIEIPIAKDVHVAIIHEWNEEFISKEWNTYILNDRNTPIDMVLIVSKGHDGERKTSTMRHAIGMVEAKAFAKIEMLQEELFALNNEFFVTYYAGNYIYENNKLQFFSHAEGTVSPKNINDYSQGFEYTYNYTDHLGNIRLSYTDANNDGDITTNEIVKESNYYPFGLKHKGYNFVINGTDHKYGFGNKEEQDELGLAWMDFGARNYNASIGRWMNLDPLAENMRDQSTYNYAFNNPIAYFDPDGMFPIIIHIRSFVPSKRFALGNNWTGDNRNFSTNNSVSTRLHQTTNYETDNGNYSHRAEGTMSYSSFGAVAYSDAYVDDSGSSHGNIRSHLYGKNEALLPAIYPYTAPPDGGLPSPNIDIHTNLNIKVSKLKNGNQLLNISGNIIGDAFPNAESYVEDSKGNSIFLGIFATNASLQTGMLTELPFSDDRPMMSNINLSIITDSKGVFTGLQFGKKTISIKEWNSNFESLSVDEFREKYGEYYDQLFGKRE